MKKGLLIILIGLHIWQLSLEVSLASTHQIKKQKIVLATSANLDQAFALRDTTTWFGRYTEKLERMVREYFPEQDYEISYYHGVNAYHIHQLLNQGNVVGFFYMAHAGFSRGGAFETNLLKRTFISDNGLNDITKAFKSIHPNVRYIGLVGCTTEAGLEGLKEQGYFSNPQLTVQGFTETVGPLAGLRTSLIRARRVLMRPSIKNGYENSCEEVPGHLLAYSQRIPPSVSYHLSPPVMVELNDKLIGVLPPLEKGRIQRGTLWIPITTPIRRDIRGQSIRFDLKIVASTGAVMKASRNRETGEIEVENDPLTLGILNFESSFTLSRNGYWEVLGRRLNPNGIGINRKTFRFYERTPVDTTQTSQSYLPYSCTRVRPVTR